jgi:hypothetical protein
MRHMMVFLSLELFLGTASHAQPRGGTTLPVGNHGSAAVLPTRVKTAPVRDLQDRAWWAEKTSSYDFATEDKIDADAYNRVLWDGIKGPRR